MPKYEFTLSVTIAGVECEHTAVAMYDYYKAERGHWRDGLQMEPDYPANVEVWEVYLPVPLDKPFIYLDSILNAGQYEALEEEILLCMED